MIKLYSGTPGSGKSLHSAKDIIDWARKGKPVLTNFVVDLSAYPKANHSYVEDDDLTPDFLAEYSRNFFGGRKLTKKDEDTILLVIDECQLVFNSRDYQRKDRKHWIRFFSTHRHLGYRIILVAQMDKMIDKQIRGLIEYEVIHRKLSNFGKAGKIISFFTGGEMFTAVEMWYPLKLKVGNQFFRAKKRYWSIYDSYASFGDPKAAALPDPKPAQEQSDVEAAPEPLNIKVQFPILDLPEPTNPLLRFSMRLRIGRQGKYSRPAAGRNELGWKVSKESV